MHALRGWRAHRRLVIALALTLSVLLVALVAVQAVAGNARAAVSLLCNQQTLYSVASQGSPGKLSSIDVSGDTGNLTAADVATFAPSNNALGLTSDGGSAYSTKSASTGSGPNSNQAPFTTTLQRFDAGATGPTTVTTALPVPTYPVTANGATTQTPFSIIRGAVDPANGLYYYGTNTATLPDNTTQMILLAYDLVNNRPIGQVGQINGALPGGGTSNGDLAFSTSGDLFVVGANQVIRVDSPPSDASTSRVLTTKTVATLANTVNSPGIAFTSDGFLYVTSTATTTANGATTYATTVFKLNPANGSQVWSRTVNGSFQSSDLATCNYPDTVQNQVSVDHRWNANDQFTVSLTSQDDSQQADPATTSGNAEGLQTAKAGAILTIPGRKYAVSEAAAGTTDLTNYTTTWSCVDQNDPSKQVIASGTGTSGSVTVPATPVGRSAGTEVVCTFANAMIPVHSAAANDTATTPVNVAVSGNVLTNDAGTDLTVTGNTQPSHAAGTLTVAKDGSYTYTPVTDFSGKDTFTYTATDGSGATSTATVTITVTPTAADDVITTTAGTAGSVSLIANDHGTALGAKAVVTANPSNGTVTIDQDGVATYTPNDPKWSGADSFRYSVTDPDGGTASAKVTVTVSPKAANDTITTDTGASGSTSLLANDTGSDLTVTNVSRPGYGTVTVDGNGVATYTPNDPTFSGTDSFTYTVTDGTSTSAPATVSVTVGPKANADAYSTPAGTELDVAAPGVLANDTGSGLTVTGNSAPTKGGTVTVAANGSFSYQPAAGFSGDDTFRYTATDSSGNATKGTVTITVTPTAAADTITTTAGQPGTVTVTANDSGSSLTAAVTTAPTHGSASIDGNGVATYTPNDGFSGTDSFTYTVTDAAGRTATATVSVTVVPKANDDTLATTAGAPGTAALLDNDQGAGLTATIGSAPTNGTVSVDPKGVATYTPNTGFSGTDSFTYTVSDGTSTSKPATVTVTVAPKAVDDTATTTAGGTVTSAAPGVLGNDSGTALQVTGHTDPKQGGTLDIAPDGSYTYTAPKDFSGTDSFTYTVTDGSDQHATATVTVTVAPTAGDDTITGSAGSPATGNVLTNDHGTALTPTVTTQPTNGTVTIGSDGTATYTPKPGTSGKDGFTYTVTDPTGGTATGTVTVVIAPTAANDRIQSLVDQAGSANLLANDSGTGLTVTAHTDPQHGTVVVDPDGSATFTPDSGWSGNTSFTYTVTDASQQTATATVTVTVGVVTKDDTATTPAETTITVDRAHGVLANDRGDQLTASIVSDRGPQHGNVTLNGDGSYTYTPVDGFSGTDGFTYTATDSSGVSARGTVTITVTPTATAKPLDATAGAPAGGTITVVGQGTTTAVTTAPQHGTVTLHDDGTYTYTPAPGYSGGDTFTVTVTDGSGQKTTVTVPVTVAPSAVDDAYGTPAGTKLVVPAAKGVLANDIGSGLRVTGTTAPAHGTVSVANDGSLVYTPTKGYSGTDSFDYVVTDGTTQATATVTITVGLVSAPDTGTATADTPLTVDAAHGLLANDSGSSLTAAKATDPSHGTVTVAKDGSYVYTPADGYSGPDSFTYTVTDGSGAKRTETVTITVLPKAVDDSYRTPTNHALDVVAPGVLGNDDGTGITVTAVGTPGHGTATIAADGTVHYVPTTGYSGTDAFTYTITDRSGGTATATVTVSVRPWAAPDTQSTPAGTALVTTPATGVLANDHGTGLTVTDHTDPSHGTLVLAADGSGTYTPAAGFSGTDSYTYTLTDQAGQTSTTTVIVVVGPMATADTGTTTADTTLTVGAGAGVLANDSGTGLTATIDLAPKHGTVTLAADGSYVYTPTDGYSGTDVFTYTATDASGTTATGVVTITVLPKATNDAYRTPANTAVTKSAETGPLANDVGRRLRVVAVGTPKHGTTTLGATGDLVYTPAKGFSGVDSYTYEITDITGARAQATITVTVLPTAKNDTYTAVGGRTLRITPDHGILGDDSGSGLWAQLASKPAHGTVTVAPDGSFVYTPDAGYTGPDSFTYTTTDAAGNTATATVFLTVAAPATAKDDSAHGKPGKPTTIAVLGNDTPTGGSTFDTGSLVVVDPVSKGIGATVTVKGQGDWAVQDGTLVFTPAPGFSGTATITYRVTDSAGVTVSAVATVDYPTPAQVAATTLAFTGAAGLGWLALIAAGAILLGAVLRRRQGGTEAGPRRAGD